MKIADASTKILSNDGAVFDSPSHFLEEQEYVKHFPTINKVQLQRKVCVSCKIESSLRLSQFKFGERKIMEALIKHNTFINYDKYKHTKKIVSDGLSILAQHYHYKNYKTPFRRSTNSCIHDKGGNKSTN